MIFYIIENDLGKVVQNQNRPNITLKRFRFALLIKRIEKHLLDFF